MKSEIKYAKVLEEKLKYLVDQREIDFTKAKLLETLSKIQSDIEKTKAKDVHEEQTKANKLLLEKIGNIDLSIKYGNCLKLENEKELKVYKDAIEDFPKEEAMWFEKCNKNKIDYEIHKNKLAELESKNNFNNDEEKEYNDFLINKTKKQMHRCSPIRPRSSINLTGLFDRESTTSEPNETTFSYGIESNDGSGYGTYYSMDELKSELKKYEDMVENNNVYINKLTQERTQINNTIFLTGLY